MESPRTRNPSKGMMRNSGRDRNATARALKNALAV